MQKENTPEKMNEEAEDFVAPKQKKASKRKMDIDSSEKVNKIILALFILAQMFVRHFFYQLACSLLLD